ncbi:MAG: formylglycine-generating enzyme family protein [bacterium]|nr:formylglycine-generating enzyme family protein [bacterium]
MTRTTRISGITRFQAHPFTRCTALFLCFLLLPLVQPGYPGVPHDFRDSPDSSENKLEGPFRWAKKHYLEGKYRETVRKLEVLLTYLDGENGSEAQPPEVKRLRGRIYLLLGAAKEKLGKIVAARKTYMLAKRLIGKPKELPEIEELDFGQLVEYQRIIMDNTKPMMDRVIEREARRPKKKRVSPTLVIAGLVVVTILLAVFVKKKKRPDSPFYAVDSNYDTRELGIHWVEIPGTLFMMGDNFNEGELDEQPVHPVSLDTYHISKYEITFNQYDAFCLQTGKSLPPDEGWGRGKRPVINVSRQDAADFCVWLSQRTGKTIRLPTEAQWEMAARGTDRRRYPWGNATPNCSFTNYCCSKQTDPVGSYPAGVSPYGVHDMGGNVVEWCRDWYDSTYYAVSPSKNPLGPGTGTTNSRVVRGGSWNCNGVMSIRAADRGSIYASVTTTNPYAKFNDLGFRIVLEEEG